MYQGFYQDEPPSARVGGYATSGDCGRKKSVFGTIPNVQMFEKTVNPWKVGGWKYYRGG